MSLSTLPPQAMPSRLSYPPVSVPLKQRSSSPDLPKSPPADSINVPAPLSEHSADSAVLPLATPSSPPRVHTPTLQPTAAAAAAPDPADNETEEEPYDPIDMEMFQQVLELDEDGDDEFSREMVLAYLTQARETFAKMDKALAAKDLAELSSLGHFLKGSSAALGITRVQAPCEKIQHLGKLRDEELDTDLAPADALARIAPLIARAKRANDVAESWLKDWYEIADDNED